MLQFADGMNLGHSRYSVTHPCHTISKAQTILVYIFCKYQSTSSMSTFWVPKLEKPNTKSPEWKLEFYILCVMIQLPSKKFSREMWLSMSLLLDGLIGSADVLYQCIWQASCCLQMQNAVFNSSILNSKSKENLSNSHEDNQFKMTDGPRTRITWKWRMWRMGSQPRSPTVWPAISAVNTLAWWAAKRFSLEVSSNWQTCIRESKEFICTPTYTNQSIAELVSEADNNCKILYRTWKTDDANVQLNK